MSRIFKVSMILCFILISCQQEKDIDGIINSGSMNLQELKSGQKFKYTLLKGYAYQNDFDEYFNFSYTGDTLVLEIINVTDQQIQVKESITLNSNINYSSEDYYWGKKDSIFLNTWIIENDSLKINGPLNSHLFPRTYFPINHDANSFVDWKSWETNFPFFFGDNYYYTTDFILNEIDFDSIGIYVNNEPISYDGMGATIFCNLKHGIVRTGNYNPWTNKVQGWDRIR